MKQIHISTAAFTGLTLHSLSMSVNAQSITVAPATPVTTAAIPVDNPWSLLALAIGLAVAAWLVLRNRQHRALFMALCTSAIMCATLWHSPDLRAQLAGSFTNPAGETRPLIVAQIVNGGNLEGFSAEDFTNGSGALLRVTAIQPPNLNQCFPTGFAHLTPPSAPPASPPPPCAVGNTIVPNGVCRVNVDTMCRTEAAEATAAAGTTALSVSGQGLSFLTGGSGTVNVTNSGTSAALNVRAVIPAGSGIIVSANSCAASLPAGANCTLTFTALTAEGPTTITIKGSNTQNAAVPVTVTPPVQLTTLNIPLAPISFGVNAAGSVTITNVGTAPALNVQATIPAGSSIAVASTTCAASLPTGTSCTIYLTAAGQEGPTSISFGGSNTPSSIIEVTVLGPVPITTLSVPSTSLIFAAGGTITVKVTNTSIFPAYNIKANAEPGSGITVSSNDCSAALAPLAYCSIVMTATAAEGPTVVSLGGSNTQTILVQITVTALVP